MLYECQSFLYSTRNSIYIPSLKYKTVNGKYIKKNVNIPYYLGKKNEKEKHEQMKGKSNKSN